MSRVINLLGAELGGNLMAAAGDNERGFWEHEGAVSIHEELLTRLGHRWCDGTPLPDGWMETEAAKQAQMQIATLIDLDFLSQPLWAIKDPRMSLLFPLWLPLLKERGMQPHCIVAWRNPAEVAASLEKRDGMALEPALLCWLAYTIESLEHALNFPHAVLAYDSLLTDWRSAVTCLGSALGVAWPNPPEKIAAEVGAFLTPELRHHQTKEYAIRNSETGRMVEECLALLAASDADKIHSLHRRWRDYSLPFAPLLREVRRTEMEFRDRAFSAEHTVKDLKGQMAKLYEEYGRAIEREKEALVHVQMLQAGLRHAEEKLAELHESTSWKVTEPLRKVKKLMEGD